MAFTGNIIDRARRNTVLPRGRRDRPAQPGRRHEHPARRRDRTRDPHGARPGPRRGRWQGCRRARQRHPGDRRRDADPGPRRHAPQRGQHRAWPTCACTRSTPHRPTPQGTIHRTKAEADLDEADHPAVGVTRNARPSSLVRRPGSGGDRGLYPGSAHRTMRSPEIVTYGVRPRSTSVAGCMDPRCRSGRGVHAWPP